jgi:hypothetical protein
MSFSLEHTHLSVGVLPQCYPASLLIHVPDATTYSIQQVGERVGLSVHTLRYKVWQEPHSLGQLGRQQADQGNTSHRTGSKCYPTQMKKLRTCLRAERSRRFNAFLRV